MFRALLNVLFLCFDMFYLTWEVPFFGEFLKLLFEHLDLLVSRIFLNSPVLQNARPVRLHLPVTQESTKSLKTLLGLHANRFEMAKSSIVQVIISK